MQRKEIMVNLVRSIAERLNATDPFTDECYTTIGDNLDTNKLKDAINSIFEEKANTHYTQLLNKIKQLSDDENLEELDNQLNYKLEIADEAHKSLVKPFLYHKPNECLVVTTEYLFEKCNDVIEKDEIFIAVERIFLAVKDDEVKKTSFLECIEQKKESGYMALHNTTAFDAWNLYGYACLCHINESSFDIPSDLSYPSATKFYNAVLSYDASIPYVQYFDVYNVMNESKHTQDILGRYLRMYQVLEYFTFRVHLVSIANKSIRNSAFIRTVIKEAHKASTKEEEEFQKVFASLFPNITDANKIDQASLSPYNTFLEKNYSIMSGDQHTAKKVARVVYKLRNSIVHNKATELHFTYGNVEEYTDGINLLKMITRVMEEEIVNLIVDPNNQLKFDNKDMPLY